MWDRGRFREEKWGRVREGMVVRVREGEYMPADMVVVECNGGKGVCYVETKSLDGETNLKHRTVEKHIHTMVKGEEGLESWLKEQVIICDEPND